MFLIVKCDSTIQKGDVLEFDDASQKWTLSTAGSNMIAVARNDASIREVDSVETYVTDAVFAGSAYAKASRDIGSEGGRLAVENGAVYVIDQSDSRCVILPADINVSSRSVNSLVRCNIR
jgi:hypothetical protein